MRMFGFKLSTSPPHSFFVASSLSSSPSTTGFITSSRSPVSSHSLAAKPASCTCSRSFTLTASPRLGLPGVVVNGSVFKKLT